MKVSGAVAMADDVEHAFGLTEADLRKSGSNKIIVSKLVYEHAEAAGMDMRYFVIQRPIPTNAP